MIMCPGWMGIDHFIASTEDCKLAVTCKMQNRNATDKLNPQCSKLALFANTITGRITMLIYYIVDLADQLHVCGAWEERIHAGIWVWGWR